MRTCSATPRRFPHRCSATLWRISLPWQPSCKTGWLSPIRLPIWTASSARVSPATQLRTLTTPIYRTWSQTSLDTTLGALRAAGLQSQQLQSEQTVLNALRGMAQSADGRMQALQVSNQIAEQQVEQLMKLRELMLADLSSKQAYQAAQVQQQAATEAATER